MVLSHLLRGFSLAGQEGKSHSPFTHYRKASLLDALVNKQTRDDLDRLLEVNHDAFADDERQIGTTPSLKCP